MKQKRIIMSVGFSGEYICLIVVLKFVFIQLQTHGVHAFFS